MNQTLRGAQWRVSNESALSSPEKLQAEGKARIIPLTPPRGKPPQGQVAESEFEKMEALGWQASEAQGTEG